MLADPRPRPVPTVQDRSVAAPPRRAADGARLRRMLVAGPVVAVVSMVMALARDRRGRAAAARSRPRRRPAPAHRSSAWSRCWWCSTSSSAPPAARPRGSRRARRIGERAARALDAAAGRRRRHRPGELLRELPGVPQPQEHGPAAPSRRPLRPPARRPRPRAVRGNDPAALLHGMLGTGAADAGHVDGATCCCSSSFPGRSPRRSSSRRTSRRGCSTRARSRSTGCSAPRATSCCRRLGRCTWSPRCSRSCRPPARPSSRRCCSTQRIAVPAGPGGGHGAEHRGLRVAARVDLLHRRARRAHARPRAAAARRGVGARSALTVAVDDLPRVALRARRHRRRAARRAGDRAGPRPDRVRPAPRAADRPPRSPHRRDDDRARPPGRRRGRLARRRRRPGGRRRHGRRSR